jgi:PPOX class probable F420-dependent enzyme
VGEFDPKVRFTQSPVARLATVTPDGIPHLVPVVFALDDYPQGNSDVIYTAVDAKPKTTQRLRRLANIASNPQVSLLVDHYADDWAQLWWVRVDGVAAIHRDGAAMRTGYRLLRAKYAQYQSVPLNGPVIAITVRRWSSWAAALGAPAPNL